MITEVRIGSRPSKLALVQAEIVRSQLSPHLPGTRIVIVKISTSGDKLATASLANVGGKGLFIRELEQALGSGKIDLAVHSMKDLPAVLPEQFEIAAVPPRELSHDVIVSRTGANVEDLAAGARVGTSSQRRRFQALRKNPQLEIAPLRGNVDTRVRTVAEDKLDAVILAAAGLKRLGELENLKYAILDERDFIPTGGQGALAVESMRERSVLELSAALAQISDPRSCRETAAERAFLAAIGASCVTPVGVRASERQSGLSLRAILFSADGVRSLHEELDAPADYSPSLAAAQALGASLGERMLSRGAKALIDG